MAFGGTTHRGITRHERDTIEIHSQQERLVSHTCTRQRSFTACMTSANDYYLICSPYHLFWRNSIVFGFVAHIYILDLFDVLFQVNDYFHIYEPYYDVDYARRQYDWEECLDDWLKP